MFTDQSNQGIKAMERQAYMKKWLLYILAFLLGVTIAIMLWGQLFG